jgi:hypothetical protein
MATYKSLAVRDVHVTTGVAPGTGPAASLLDDLGCVKLKALLATSLVGGGAGVKGLFLAKVGAVIVHFDIVRGNGRFSCPANLLGAFEQCGQLRERLLNRFGLLGLLRRLLLVGLDLGLGEFLLLCLLLRKRCCVEHLQILLVGG